ncbi:MAG TPA: ATP-binding protein [Planctomycetota bacterium]|nr:ATP-binding protein [Planctomycetota bacterium]
MNADRREAPSLTAVIRELAGVRELPRLVEIVGRAARQLTRADGGAFVLREGDQVHYVEVDAREPLWKGRRFPASCCISGWSILNRAPVAIEDIFADPRIPHDVYRPTFVKSLAMVPIRPSDPLGALGVYWARRHAATSREMGILRDLADATAIAFANIALYDELRRLNEDLERRVAERTARLEEVLRELDAFAQHVAHDLRAPLRAMRGFAQIALEELGTGPEAAGPREWLGRVLEAGDRMDALIVDLLAYSRLARAELPRERTDLDRLLDEVLLEARPSLAERRGEVVVDRPLGNVVAHAPALKQVFHNLLSNAIKFVAPGVPPRVRIYAEPRPPRRRIWVEDNGIGIAPEDQERIFRMFERLHTQDRYPGTGIGLAIVRRAMERMSGGAGVESRPGEGSRFWIELPAGDV